jgi:hypothetical protein
MGLPALAYTAEEIEDYDDTWSDEEPWLPEGVIPEEEPFVPELSRKATAASAPQLLPSQFTSRAFVMPNDEGTGFGPFSFHGRRHLPRIYDSPARRILLCCGRQVEKSTMLGNRAICYASLVPALRILYVSPSATQTKTFSNDRIKEPVETSPLLRKFTTKMLSQNILDKQFINRSKITLRYAFLNADRTRGIPAWQLYLDEVQDILRDNIPVIEQCTSHAPDRWKAFLYAGTPKSLDNVIEEYRANKSTQGEWVVPCGCNNWNVLGEHNIGKKGPICSKCGRLIDPQGEKAQWAWMVEPDKDRIKIPWESYRVPQLMVPWKIRNWNEVLHDYENYPRARFMNECLGISFENGTRPITQAQIQAQCGDYSMADFESLRNTSLTQPYFFGIDWGSGDNSYTILTVSTYVNNRFRVVYAHRFSGEEADPHVQVNRIIDLGRAFNVALIGADYGFGFGMNHHLVRAFGANKVHTFQHMARINKRVVLDTKLLRWKIHRTEVMSAIFEAIKKGKAEFPRWDEWRKPFAEDMTNIYAEYNEKLRMVQYDHKAGSPDDTFHAFMFGWLASMIVIKRPDIIAPTLEGEDGTPISPYNGTTFQG